MGNPTYIRLYEEGILGTRIKNAINALNECRLCPRECGVDRLNFSNGFCRTGRLARIASYGPHFGEEAPLVGTHGSGTIFFSSCNLLCTFCQNHEISHGNPGRDVTPSQLATMMIELQEMGCHNINLVTPSHIIAQLLEALPEAIENGLCIPLVYNTGCYDSTSTLKLLEGIIDIYMPDFKFWDNKYARRFCKADDYREIACSALIEMHSQVGDLIIDDGISLRGIILRHLIMPGEICGTGEIMNFIADNISKNTYINIMDQYRPCFDAHSDNIIDRRITAEEHSHGLKKAIYAGLKRIDGCEAL